jgi:hypothetical protein
VESIVQIVEALSMEENVVLISRDLSALAPCAEALLSFMFPLAWPHVYIPLLPSTFLETLDAPVPFFVGMDANFL